MGVRGDGKAQILSGVKAGENVAVGANFLLDSESKLRAALTRMTGGASAPSQPQPKSQSQSPPPPPPQGQGGHAGDGGGQVNPHGAGSPGEPVKESFIQRVIGFCAVNRYLTLFAVAAAVRVRGLHPQGDPSRRAAGPVRHAGHRLLQVGPVPRHHRGPGDVPDRGGAAGRPERQGDPRFLRLRLLVRVRDLPGRNRHLLGPLPRAGIHVQDPVAAAEGRADRAGAGCHGGGLDLPVRAGRPLRHAFARPAPLVPGLDAALRLPVRSRGRRGGVDRRFPEAVPGDGRPEQADVLRHSAHHGHRSDPDVEQRGGRTPHRVRGRRIHGAGTRVYQEPVRSRKRGGEDGRRRRPRPAEGCRTRGVRTRNPARRLRPRRAGRPCGRHRGDAPRRERAQRHRAGQGEDEGAGAVAAERGRVRSDLRPLRPHPPGDRDAQARAHRRDGHRRAGDPPFPVARPFRDGADHHDSRLGAFVLHSPLLHGGDGQHHEHRRHRHLDRRARRRGDRRGRKRLQQDLPLGRRRAERRLPRDPSRGAEGGRPFRLLLAARHRRRVPPRLHAGRPGRAAVQAAGVFEEPGDGAGRAPRDHAQPGAADDVRPDRPVHLQADVPREPGHARFRRQILFRREAPDQPRAVPHLRAGVPLRAAPPENGHRRRAGGVGGERSRLLQARQRVHAAAQRRHHALHADDVAGAFRRAGAGPDDPHGQAAEKFPRSRARLRQGGARRHVHRPGAVLDDGNDGGAERPVEVEREGALVLELGAGIP